jgi:hypothetical protein
MLKKDLNSQHQEEAGGLSRKMLGQSRDTTFAVLN